MTVGNGRLSSLEYCFYNQQLLAVFIRTVGAENSLSLLDALQAKYGAGTQSNPYLPNYMWGTELQLLSYSPLLISYERNTATGNAQAILQSKAIAAEQNAARTNAASNAASNF
jgi:hypothetical protein